MTTPKNIRIDKALLAVSGPNLVAAMPVVALLAYGFFGENALLAAAVVMPAFYVLLSKIQPEVAWHRGEIDTLTGSIMRDGLISWIDAAMAKARRSDREVAVINLVIDDLDALEERFGRDLRNAVIAETAERLRGFLRDDDIVAWVSPGFSIGLRNVRAPETENLLQLSRRLQSILDEPFCIGTTRTYCSMSLGIASECHVEGTGGAKLVTSAGRACELAQLSGPGSVRIFSEGLSSDRTFERDQARLISNALESGEIFAWFQPQIDAATGRVTGPHLHWSLKWHLSRLDPLLFVGPMN